MKLKACPYRITASLNITTYDSNIMDKLFYLDISPFSC